MNDKLIAEIVAAEWNMFQNVRNEGGRASCQDDYPTFDIMRTSQFRAWDEDTLLSYMADLKQAAAVGRNLLAEKYAHMMASTAPGHYARLAPELHMPTDEEKALARDICGILVAQTEQYARKYPLLSEHGRPLRSNGDTEYDTSIETYQLGELYTYSRGTLERLYSHIKRVQAAGQNFAEQILEFTVERYGFRSIGEAEAAAKNQIAKSASPVPGPEDNGCC